MAFSDELKNGVEKDIEGYNQEINNYIPRLKDEYIKENDTFIDDYFSSRIKDSNIDLSGVPYERKKAMALKEFAKYDLENGTNYEEDFNKGYEEYLNKFAKNKEKIIHILIHTQDEFAEKIKETEEKLKEANNELLEQEKEIKEKEDKIRDTKVERIKLETELDQIKKDLEEIQNEINDLSKRKDELEGKDKLTKEEEKELESIKNQIDSKLDESKNKRDELKDKEIKINDKNTEIKNLEKEKSDLQTKHTESQKIYNDAKESLEKAKEAYVKNGEEILRIAKENGIDVNGIFNEKNDLEDGTKGEKKDKNEKGSNDAKEVPAGSAINQDEQNNANLPSKYSPDAMNDFAKCSNSSDRKAKFIDNPAGYAALCDSLKNRSMLNFWKNHRVNRALADNNKELLKNMKDSSEYSTLLDNALGSNLSTDEKKIFENLFDKDSPNNILNGFSKYTDKDMENLYNIVNKLNSKDLSNNPELAKKINSDIMPYIKSGVLNDLANRKILGRFNTKYEMTGKNQRINYISDEIASYSAKHGINSNIKKDINPFTSRLYQGVNKVPVNSQPVNNQPTIAPTQGSPEKEQR